MRWVFITVLPLLLVGCSGRPDHALSGGKPVEARLRALKEANPQARREAVEKLGNVGAMDPLVVPALQEALNDKDARVRGAAILALVKCGARAATPALPALAEMQVNDSDRKVRDYAKEALTAFQRGAK